MNVDPWKDDAYATEGLAGLMRRPRLALGYCGCFGLFMAFGLWVAFGPLAREAWGWVRR